MRSELLYVLLTFALRLHLLEVLALSYFLPFRAYFGVSENLVFQRQFFL